MPVRSGISWAVGCSPYLTFNNWLCRHWLCPERVCEIKLPHFAKWMGLVFSIKTDMVILSGFTRNSNTLLATAVWLLRVFQATINPPLHYIQLQEEKVPCSRTQTSTLCGAGIKPPSSLPLYNRLTYNNALCWLWYCNNSRNWGHDLSSLTHEFHNDGHWFLFR